MNSRGAVPRLTLTAIRNVPGASAMARPGNQPVILQSHPRALLSCHRVLSEISTASPDSAIIFAWQDPERRS